MLRFRIFGVLCTLCLAIGLSCGLAGCSDRGEPQSPADKASAKPVVDRYELRGRIVSLPDPANPASELQIHHEAIDDFKMSDGEPAPMRSMTMAFSPGPDEKLEGIKVGDAVSFVFENQWAPAQEMRVVDIKKLPADTVLSFEQKK